LCLIQAKLTIEAQNKINRIFRFFSMKELLRRNKAILIFSLAWFVLNLIQAFFTEILEDEAYYWLYSENMAWGYFDHPPMIAFLIKLGYSIFPNELGVRLFPSLLGAGTIYIIWQLIPEGSRNLQLFILSTFSISLMHLNVAGFVALPDIPLIFFASLFFLVLKKYLDQDSFSQALLLGIVVAMMMYSKYHALLILFFTLLSNWKLLFRKTFWVIVAVAVLLYIPHILWQIRHDFISFEYHLISRNDPFQPRQILEYLGNQVLVTGPFVGVIFLYLAFARKSAGNYERMLKYNLIGFFGFFLFSSVRGHVEPHWTAAAFPPLVALAFINLSAYPGLRKWLRILGFASIPVILIIRTYLIWDILPIPGHVSRMFHNKDIWATQVEEVAGNRPVIFMNKYQYPSVYRFYSGNTSFTRNNVFYRRNQFDVWPLEEELEGKSVILTRWGSQRDSLKIMSTVFGETPYYDISRYCSFNRLKIEILDKTNESVAGGNFRITIRIQNPTVTRVNLDCECDLPPLLMYSLVNDKRKTRTYTVDPQPELNSLEPGEEILVEVSLDAPEEPGMYSLMVSFGSEILIPGINGRPAELLVTEALPETGLARE